MKEIINLDIKIHKLARQIDRELERCASNGHMSGCRCVDALIQDEGRLQDEYRAATGLKWLDKADLHKPGLELAVELWWARHGQNVAAQVNMSEVVR